MVVFFTVKNNKVDKKNNDKNIKKDVTNKKKM
jgi:hypothetical protein